MLPYCQWKAYMQESIVVTFSSWRLPVNTCVHILAQWQNPSTVYRLSYLAPVRPKLLWGISKPLKSILSLPWLTWTMETVRQRMMSQSLGESVTGRLVTNTRIRRISSMLYDNTGQSVSHAALSTKPIPGSIKNCTSKRCQMSYNYSHWSLDHCGFWRNGSLLHVVLHCGM